MNSTILSMDSDIEGRSQILTQASSLAQASSGKDIIRPYVLEHLLLWLCHPTYLLPVDPVYQKGA